MDRRTLLKTLGAAGAGLAAGGTGIGRAHARARRQAPAGALGLLFDATRCVGCQACVIKCKEANNMPPDWQGGGVHNAPTDLNDTTLNIIKTVPKDGKEVYIKRQCMHCIDPGCASACMIGALQKDRQGIVTYDVSRCVGCRYCQVACPFNVPKFEWEARAPKIVKCELCRHRYKEGKGAACAEFCPRQAVIFGELKDLRADAEARLKQHPKRYLPRIYGATEVGGTQVLYLSGVDFSLLGLPKLGDKPVPEASESIQHGIYQGFILPGVLYAALGVAIYRGRRSQQVADDEQE